MWYAIVFISFMNLQHIDVDLRKEYWTSAECIVHTKTYADDLRTALKENITPVETALNKSPYIAFRCVKIPFRNS